MQRLALACASLLRIGAEADRVLYAGGAEQGWVLAHGRGRHLTKNLSSAYIPVAGRNTGISNVLLADEGHAVIAEPLVGIDEIESPLVELPGAEDFDGAGKIDGEPTAAQGKRKGPSEFELNLGRAQDTLNAFFDNGNFAYEEEGFDEIYTKNLIFTEPMGMSIEGLQNYKNIFKALRAFRTVMMNDVDVRHKLRYEPSQKKIMVTWYSTWTMRTGATTHVDAVSYFYLNDLGFVYKHEVDRVMVDGVMKSPPLLPDLQAVLAPVMAEPARTPYADYAGM